MTQSILKKALPLESPLTMPRAPLHRSRARLLGRNGRIGKALARYSMRLFLLIITFLGSAYGAWEMKGVISTGETTPLQIIFLCLFTLNFAWIMFALCQSILGFLRIVIFRNLKPVETTGPLTMKTAILLPVYNEEPNRISVAIQAMADALATKAPGRFDFFILSDSTHLDAWIHEEAVFRDLIQTAPQSCPVYYRHRRENTERKAGNIGDWVSRWGGAYDAMTILDADSIMSAKTLVTMTRRLEASPEIGLIQSIPGIVFAGSLYARLQQFANRCYGPIYASGLASWHGLSSNFWGHNAIIRVKAFAESAGLPKLPGSPPFGGHILSHDFAEAAFLRRAGWGVRLDADLEESFEESPPSLLDVIIRDRRWCQGNFQHIKLLFAKGMHPCSRMHFATGILSYLTAPIWFLLVLVGLILAAQVAFSQPEYFAEPSLFPTWPVFDSERAVRLFIISMGVLLVPKVLGWLAILLSWRKMKGFGGPILVTFNVLFETLMSALYAPIMMLSQTKIVISILSGRDAGWQPQRRADGQVPFWDVVRAHIWHTLIGIGLAGIVAWISFPLFLWLSPITLGLVLSIPLSWLSGQQGFGKLLGWLNVLRTPENKKAPEILQIVENAMTKSENTLAKIDPSPTLLRFHQDPHFAKWHAVQLDRPEGSASKDMSDALLTALAKTDREADPERLAEWLTPEQTKALVGHAPYFKKIT